jgi:uncharacterized protein YecT (DUF1311 family)
MRGTKALLSAVGLLAFSACGPAQAVITVELDTTDPETGAATIQALADIEIRLFPFDRDAIFEALAQAADRPEPPIPDSVIEAQAAVRTAQEEWQNLQQRWGILRDTLQTLSEALDGLSRASRQYRVLFNEFQDAEAEYEAADRQLNAAFERFTGVQSASLAAAEEARLIREQWADEAYADVGLVMAARLQESGREILYDTTGADGVATFEARSGSWWATARYELPFVELYWNVPIELTRDAPVQLRLTRANAQQRPKL